MEFLLDFMFFLSLFYLDFLHLWLKMPLWYQFYVTERFNLSRFNFLVYSECIQSIE